MKSEKRVQHKLWSYVDELERRSNLSPEDGVSKEKISCVTGIFHELKTILQELDIAR